MDVSREIATSTATAYRPRRGPRTGPAASQAGLLQPSRRARLLARVRARSLDRALIDGADPAGSGLLAARVAILSSPCTRRALAEGIERLVAGAQGPQRRWWALGARKAVLANSSDLHALASLLYSSNPVYARGLAILNELLCDGSSPAHHGGAAALARALSDVRSGLRG
ncbi:MAG TPA: hypothetical protein VKG82_03970 [Solirubrobacteraceae bacterium]|nr:hypothetical protein [Solirubrobacteraceae bacterium]